MRGKLFIVGTGPGHEAHMTERAKEAIAEAQTIVGYATYIELIQSLISGKEIIATGMTREIERCNAAVIHARRGKKTALVSGGDPGIYGMAGLVYELLKKERDSRDNINGPAEAEFDIEVIPGVSALNAAAAVLGSPVMHDFAVVSLSDLLTPWATIVKRLEAAAGADFVICIYNPKSMSRTAQIVTAREIVMRHRRQETPVGIVRHAMRSGETSVITTLEGMLDHEIDMATVIIIGNTSTYVHDGRMVTPRGYINRCISFSTNML